MCHKRFIHQPHILISVNAPLPAPPISLRVKLFRSICPPRMYPKSSRWLYLNPMMNRPTPPSPPRPPFTKPIIDLHRSWDGCEPWAPPSTKNHAPRWSCLYTCHDSPGKNTPPSRSPNDSEEVSGMVPTDMCEPLLVSFASTWASAWSSPPEPVCIC